MTFADDFSTTTLNGQKTAFASASAATPGAVRLSAPSSMEKFTLSIFTENRIGVLHRITTVFTRRHLSIQSLTTSETEVPGIFRFIIVLETSAVMAEKVRKQLEKIIGVIRAFALREEDVVHQELAMYKVSNARINEGDFETLIRDNHARVLSFGSDYIMIEKTGHPREMIHLFNALEPYGVMGFSRSGTIAISKRPLLSDEDRQALRGNY